MYSLTLNIHTHHRLPWRLCQQLFQSSSQTAAAATNHTHTPAAAADDEILTMIQEEADGTAMHTLTHTRPDAISPSTKG